MFYGSFVQLGWLQRAVNYCYDHILAPAFELISGLISSILSAFFENALLPLLELNMKFTLELVKTVFQNFLYNFLFSLGKMLLWCLDAVEKIFRLFAGLEPVYTQTSDGSLEKSNTFVLALLRSNYVVTALLGLIAASFVLCFLVALLATVRAMGDMGDGGRNKRTVSKVLRLTANSLLRLILIPIMALFLVMLGDGILKSVDLATNNDQVRVSDILFTMSTLDAVRTDDNESPVDDALNWAGVADTSAPDHSDAEFYNSTTRPAALYGASDEKKRAVSDFGLADKYRKPFYQRETTATGSLKRDVMAVVLQTFDIRRMDFIILIGGSLMFILIFGILATGMISRAFDLILLILVEPFFAAYMPLDEGEKFEKWQETFLGRLVSCYGTVVAVNVYLSVINLIFSNQVAFFGEGTTPGVVYIVNLIFAMVGGYCIIKVGPVVTGIMSAEAASRETTSYAMGNTLTVGAMRMLSAPVRKLGNFLIGKATDSFSEALSDALSGIDGSDDPGQGDAFGKVIKTGANGENTFTGAKKIKPEDIALLAAGKPDAKSEQKPDQKADIKDALKAELAEEVKDKAKDKVKDKDKFKENVKDSVRDDIKDDVKDKAKDKPKDIAKDMKDMLSKADSPLGYDYLEGGTMPDGPLLPPEYEFLEAGKVSDPIKNPTGYTYVGQEDARERSEKKEMDELLGAEINEQALFAAESSTGLDLDGDGKVSESAGTFTFTNAGGEIPLDKSGNIKMDELLGEKIDDNALFASQIGNDIGSVNGTFGALGGFEDNAGAFTYSANNMPSAGPDNTKMDELLEAEPGNVKMDELLGEQIDDNALFASEIGNDMGSINDIFDSSFDAEDNAGAFTYSTNNMPGADHGNMKMDELLGEEIKEVEIFGNGKDPFDEIKSGADYAGLDESFKDSFEKSYDDSFNDED